MRPVIVNLTALLFVVAAAFAFNAGLLSAGNAFFVTVATVIGFTGYQLIRREDVPFGVALKEIVAKPASYATRGGYAAYMASTAIGIVLVAQTLTYF